MYFFLFSFEYIVGEVTRHSTYAQPAWSNLLPEKRTLHPVDKRRLW